MELFLKKLRSLAQSRFITSPKPLDWHFSVGSSGRRRTVLSSNRFCQAPQMQNTAWQRPPLYRDLPHSQRKFGEK